MVIFNFRGLFVIPLLCFFLQRLLLLQRFSQRSRFCHLLPLFLLLFLLFRIFSPSHPLLLLHSRQIQQLLDLLRTLVINRQGHALRRLDRNAPHIGPLPRNFERCLLGNGRDILDETLRRHGRRPRLDGEARPGREVEVRRLQEGVESRGQSGRVSVAAADVASQANGKGLFLLVEESLPERFGQHGEDAVVGEEEVVFGEEVSFLGEGFVFLAEGGQGEYFFDAGERRRGVGVGAREEGLQGGFERVFHDEADFRRGGADRVISHRDVFFVFLAIVILRTATEMQEGMGNVDSNGFGRGIAGNAEEAQLHLDVELVVEEGGGFAGGGGVVFEEGVDGAVD
mmetsp:Transcript_18174/g.37112  ORF Transcript_18174/g.37112 Transcript_18174/m.37112 type:complete len:341 (+) Transcript_18174:844-1866(+)